MSEMPLSYDLCDKPIEWLRAGPLERLEKAERPERDQKED